MALKIIEANNTWKKHHLADVCHKITDGTHKTPIYLDSGVMFLSAKNIKNGTLDISEHRLISPEEHSQLTKRCKPEAGDIMLSKSGSLGDAVVIPESIRDFSIFESLALLKIKRALVLPEYLQQYLCSPLSKRYFWSITSGIAVKHLHLIDLRQMPLFLPPVEDQENIVRYLKEFDTAIEKTEALIGAKQQQFVWLQGKAVSNACKTLEDKHLGDAISIAQKEKITAVGALKPLTVKLHCKGIEANTRDVKIQLTEKGRPYYRRSAGEFLIGRQNFHNGGFGIIPKELDGFIASNAITSLAIDSRKLDIEFLYYYFSRKNYYLRIGHIMDGTGQKELSDKQILKLPIKLPPLPEQQRIAHTLNTAQAEIRLLQQLAEKYRTQKRGLMQKLLTGNYKL